MPKALLAAIITVLVFVPCFGQTKKASTKSIPATSPSCEQRYEDGFKDGMNTLVDKITPQFRDEAIPIQILVENVDNATQLKMGVMEALNLFPGRFKVVPLSVFVIYVTGSNNLAGSNVQSISVELSMYTTHGIKLAGKDKALRGRLVVSTAGGVVQGSPEYKESTVKQYAFGALEEFIKALDEQ